MMKNYINVAMLFLLVLGAKASSHGQSTPPTATDAPAVVVAVAPNYFPLALSSLASGETVVEVKINSDGLVASVQSISGNPVLLAGSKYVALRWQFCPIGDKAIIRTARLTFAYRLVPRGTSVDNLLPVFKLPYRVEIAHETPDDRPLPQSPLERMPSKARQSHPSRRMREIIKNSHPTWLHTLK